MHRVMFNQSLSIKISEQTRRNIERISEKQNWTLGESARYLIDAGMKAINMRT